MKNLILGFALLTSATAFAADRTLEDCASHVGTYDDGETKVDMELGGSYSSPDNIIWVETKTTKFRVWRDRSGYSSPLHSVSGTKNGKVMRPMSEKVMAGLINAETAVINALFHSGPNAQMQMQGYSYEDSYYCAEGAGICDKITGKMLKAIGKMDAKSENDPTLACAKLLITDVRDATYEY